MSKTEEKEGISFPTEDHRRFVSLIEEICRGLSIPALIKGSLSKGTAMKHSDVDLILVGVDDSKQFDRIAGSFEEVLLSEHFTTTSTYMIVYEHGLSVEFDLRRTITENDLAKSIILNSAAIDISNKYRDRIDIDSAVCPKREARYSQLMIAQMCCAKLLCSKPALARDIFCDRMEQLHQSGRFDDVRSVIQHETQEEFVDRLKQTVLLSNPSSQKILSYFEGLFKEIDALSTGSACNGGTEQEQVYKKSVRP